MNGEVQRMSNGGRRRLAERSDSGGLKGGNVRVVERGPRELECLWRERW